MGSISPTRRRLAALALCLTFLTAACSGGGGDDDNSSDGANRDGRAAASEPGAVIPLKVGPITVENISDQPAEVPAATVKQVMALTQEYVDAATVAPLLNGRASAELQNLFASTVVKRVGRSGPDRGALTDDAVPAATSHVTAKAQPVKISALTDGFGGFVMISASIDYTVRTKVKDGPITIKRFGDLYFSPNGKNKWLISAYQVGVTRDLSGKKQSAKAGEGTTPGSEDK